MTARNTIENFIRAWGSAPRGLTWSLLFLSVNYVIFLIGCSNYWLESSIVASGYEHRTQGLFYFCYEFRETKCCGGIDDVMQIERKLHYPCPCTLKLWLRCSHAHNFPILKLLNFKWKLTCSLVIFILKKLFSSFPLRHKSFYHH